MVRTRLLAHQAWEDAMKLAIAMRSAITVLLLATGTRIATLPSTAHAAAPPQLLNKTVVLSWSSTGAARSDAGRSINFVLDHKMTVYISSEGRQFARYIRSNRSGDSNKADFEPGAKKHFNGLPQEIRFQGNQLIISHEIPSGARQITATFDASFSSCTLSVIIGKSGGAPARVTGPDRITYTLGSYTTVSPTCAIQNGNAFASQ
jgi:hypothetical protein